MSDDKTGYTKEDKIINRMLDRFKLSSEAESDNRKQGLDALKFMSGGENQWDTDIWNNRVADNRPRESYNQIPQFVKRITNEMRQNMPQVKVIPDSDEDKEVADVFEGMCRYIQTSSEAEVALDTAGFYQVSSGWGYLRVLTEYENDEDDSEDQIIKIKRIPNPFMVYDDPNTLEQDKSDRKYALIVADVPTDDFNDEYDKSYGATELSSIGDSQPGWMTEETVRIAEYFEVKETKTKSPNGKKDKIERKIIWRKCTACEVLEEKEWPGKYIPLVYVAGNEINIDGKNEVYGLIKSLIPGQKQLNYWTNAATEAVALAPKSPFIMAVGQVQGLEKFWDNANTKSYPYLPYNTLDVNGVQVPPPQRMSPGTDITSFIQLVQGAQESLYSTSGIYPAALGQQSSETSGKAINARKVQGDLANFDYPDNMARAIRFLGRILVDLIPLIYDTARIVMTLSNDMSAKPVQINQKFQAPNGTAKEFDLTKGKFHVSVTTGPSYSTKREMAADSMTQLAQAYPPLMQVAGDIIVRQYDFPGADQVADRLKKSMPPQITQDDQDSPIPPQVQAQMQQAQQMIDQLTQQLHQTSEALESKQADIANKQAELAQKQQQMQLDAQDSQLNAQLEMEKIQLEREKLALETLKVEVQGAQDRVNTTNSGQSQEPDKDEEAIPETENTLMAKIDSLRQKRQADSDKMAAHQQMMMQAEQQHAENIGMQAMKDQQAAQNSAALLQGLAGVEQMMAGLIQSINAPKTVIRDPETDLILGIQ